MKTWILVLSAKALSLTALIGMASLGLATNRASGAVGTQMEFFYYNDGTQVVSDNGEPDDAVLNRLYNTKHNGIEWQFMTQHLAAGASYDIWLEGSNDGTPNGRFTWWLGRARATPQGALNATGNVYVGAPPGPSAGMFSNPLASVNLVIKAASGATQQTASFPAF